MKFTGIFLLLILMLSCASALVVKESSDNNVIIPDLNHPAKIELEITGVEPGSYNIYTLTDVKILPQTFALTSGKNKVEIYIYAREPLKERGYYTFTYNIGEHQDKMTVKVLDLKDVLEISSDSIEHDSGEVEFYVRNKEDIIIENIKVSFSSILFENVEQAFDLGRHEKKKILVDVDDDELKRLKAGAYIVKAEFDTSKGTKNLDGKIYIGEKEGIKTQEDSAGFLIHTKTISKINTGNVMEVIEISMEKNVFSRLFTSFNEEPISVDRSGFSVGYTWNKMLGPAEVFTVKAKTNYLLPLLILIAAVFIIIAFRRYTQTRIEVKKSVSHVKTKGGEFALKIKLALKARKHVENVSLIDRIPKIVKIYEKFGTVKPDKIDAANRRIQWNIGDLDAGEERVFSYIIYSKVGIVGKFSLPEALAVFEKDDEIHEVASNTAFFLSEQISKEED